MEAAMPRDELPVMAFDSAEALDGWLAGHHAASRGIWLKIAKKGSGVTTVSYEDAVAVSLCYGWIDGQKGRLDDDYWLQRLTPRKPGGRWSKINRGKAEELISGGRMKAAGLREVEQARADGRWDAAYDGQAAMEVPPDLAAALDASDRARAFFATLSSVNRYAILFRIGGAKRPETRAKRIAKYVAMLEEHQTIHP
jgi:uncharacterized protein YdeI (YjbR/CyaY-like superfamily)